MKVNIYYGGRGLLDDPTLYVLNKMEEVLRELRVMVERINIYEHKNEIATLPQTMKEADGIILATTIEWLGIGGYMQPIVMSTTYGEREGEMTLANAWEILGGLPCPGLCGYVEDLVSFEMNKDYTVIIEKKAENLYRTISQKMKSLPNSNLAVRQSVLRTPQLELTPQEREQLSKYVSDDSYVKKQKEDIQELASRFKDMLGKVSQEDDVAYIDQLRNAFVPQQDFHARYLFMFADKKKPLFIEVKDEDLMVRYGQEENIDIYAKLTPEVMDGVIAGRMTFQRAFMTGEMTAKGNFKILRMLDTVFNFA